MPPYHHTIKDLLVREVRRRLKEEGLMRIRKCLSELTEEEIWYRPNANSNSVGNLVLHLCGNVRQWIVSGLGEQPDVRDRTAEFNEKGPIPADVLINRLEEVLAEADEVLKELPPEKIIQPVKVQGFDETGLSILIHVVEHFSYHTGQITYFVKWKKDVDTAYYGEMDLDRFGKGGEGQ